MSTNSVETVFIEPLRSSSHVVCVVVSSRSHIHVTIGSYVPRSCVIGTYTSFQFPILRPTWMIPRYCFDHVNQNSRSLFNVGKRTGFADCGMISIVYLQILPMVKCSCRRMFTQPPLLHYYILHSRSIYFR